MWVSSVAQGSLAPVAACSDCWWKQWVRQKTDGRRVASHLLVGPGKGALRQAADNENQHLARNLPPLQTGASLLRLPGSLLAQKLYKSD